MGRFLEKSPQKSWGNKWPFWRKKEKGDASWVGVPPPLPAALQKKIFFFSLKKPEKGPRTPKLRVPPKNGKKGKKKNGIKKEPPPQKRKNGTN